MYSFSMTVLLKVRSASIPKGETKKSDIKTKNQIQWKTILVNSSEIKGVLAAVKHND